MPLLLGTKPTPCLDNPTPQSSMPTFLGWLLNGGEAQTKHEMRPTRFVVLATIVLFTAIFLSAPAYAFAKSPKVDVAEQEQADHQGEFSPPAPTPEQMQAAKSIVKQLQKEHYIRRFVDDELSSELLDELIKNLDPNRLFLLQADIDEFENYRTRLDDQLRVGKLEAGFTIYNRFQKRLTERLEWITAKLPALLKGFDFTAEESFLIDREAAPWPKNNSDADELWRKQLKNRVLGLRLSDKPEEEILELLTKRYENQLNRVKQTESEDVFQIYMNSLGATFDPHTSYFSPRTAANFQINMSLKLEGIGAVLQSKDEYTKIVRLVPGGPAAKQGQLKPADRIVGVAQGRKGEFEDIIGWRLDDVVDKIRGPAGSIVRLQVIAAASVDEVRSVVVIERNEVKLEEQSAKKEILEYNDNGRTRKIGVIDVPAFYLDFEAVRNRDPNFRSTTKDVRKLLAELQVEGVEGVIIDLRENGGGSLRESTELTSLFIEKGPTVQIRRPKIRKVYLEQKPTASPYYKGPLMVLVNRTSASASEIFAAALQDYERAIVVGTQTFGKGTVQSVNPLEHGNLKLTESKFYRISGDSTQNRGVIPDILFPPIYNAEEVGESALENAMAWDSIRRVPHQRYHDFKQALPSLDASHKTRVSHDPDFEYLKERYDWQLELANTKVLSLNEEARKLEREKNKTRALELENKRRIAKGLEPKESLEEDEEEEPKEETEEEKERLKKESPSYALLREAGEILLEATPLFTQKKTAVRLYQFR